MNSRVKHREAWVAQQLTTAVSFTAVGFLGHPAGYDVRSAATLEEARQLRQQMIAEYVESNYGRGACIYAVTASGMTLHVE